MALTKVQNEMLVSGGGGGALVVQTKTTTYVILSTDDVLLADTSGGGWTATLPAASAKLNTLVIKKTTNDFNVLTIARAGSDTIQDIATGSTSTTLNTQGEEITLVSNGSTVWQVVGRRIPDVLTSYTPTFSAFGTPTSVNVFWGRSGDSILITGSYVLGSCTASAANMSLPSGLHVDNGGKVPAIRSFGTVLRNVSSALSLTLNGSANDTVLAYGLISFASSAPLTQINGNTIGNTETHLIQSILVPIDGWKG